jgi:hypothetical protein
MARIGSVVLGVGLVVLWIMGLNQGATQWLTWMVGLSGLVSFVIAALVPAGQGEPSSVSPAVVGLALVGLWLFGLGLRATPWLSWLAFVFGCAYLAVGTLAASRTRHLHFGHHHRTA